MIGLVQSGGQGMADRYTYIPLIGIFMMMAWGISDLTNRWRHQTLFLTVVTGITFITLIVLTRYQLRYWQNTVTLFEHAVDVMENNVNAHINLARELSRQGKTEEALTHYRRAVKAEPDNIGSYMHLGKALASQGSVEEAILSYQKALRHTPDPRLRRELKQLINGAKMLRPVKPTSRTNEPFDP